MDVLLDLLRMSQEMVKYIYFSAVADCSGGEDAGPSLSLRGTQLTPDKSVSQKVWCKGITCYLRDIPKDLIYKWGVSHIYSTSVCIRVLQQMANLWQNHPGSIYHYQAILANFACRNRHVISP